jgi:hypothetical protein
LYVHPKTGDVYGAAIGNYWEYLKHLKNVSHPCPSLVFKVSQNLNEDRFFGKNVSGYTYTFSLPLFLDYVSFVNLGHT